MGRLVCTYRGSMITLALATGTQQRYVDRLVMTALLQIEVNLKFPVITDGSAVASAQQMSTPPLQVLDFLRLVRLS